MASCTSLKSPHHTDVECAARVREARPMRGTIQDVNVRFRINHRLMIEAREKADREGMSVSELLRTALRREIRA